MQFFKRLALRLKATKRRILKRFKLFQLRILGFVYAIKSVVVSLFNVFILLPCTIVWKIFNFFVWRHVVRFYKWFAKKTSFLRWKVSPFNVSEPEGERYALFLEVLGGWKNVLAFKCKAKSWHLKIMHSFLIDWEKFPHFGIEVLVWEWPYLSLSVGSYSWWIYKRLERTTKMPKRIKKNKDPF